MSRSTFLNVDDTKAGMNDLDKEKINKLIEDASKSMMMTMMIIDFILCVMFLFLLFEQIRNFINNNNVEKK